MSRTELPRIAILGAGPIGLEAALYAAALKLPFTVYERGRVGEHLHQWGHVRLFSPFGMNTTPLGRAAIRAEQPAARLPRRRATASPAASTSPPTSSRWPSRRCCDCISAPRRQVLHVGRRGFLKDDSAGRRRARPAAVPPAACATARPGARRGGRRRARLHRHLRPAPLAGRRRHPGRRRDRGRAAHRLRPGGHARRAKRATTPASTSWSSAAATRRRRRSATSPRLAEKHPETWVIWLARGTRHAADPAHRQRPAARARPAGRAGQHAGHARRGQRRVSPAGGRSTPSSAPGQDKGFKRAAAAVQRQGARPGRWSASSPTSATRRTPTCTASCRSTSATPRWAR